MYPLDFEEFISCVGISTTIVKSLREAWLNRTPVDEFVHNKILELFRLYLIVGGMPAYNVEEPKTPLLLARSRNLFKLFQSDIGLLASLYAEGIQLRIIKGGNDINFGSIYENAVAQELVANGLYHTITTTRSEANWTLSSNWAAIIYTPIYMIMFFEKDNTAPTYYKVDLSGL